MLIAYNNICRVVRTIHTIIKELYIQTTWYGDLVYKFRRLLNFSLKLFYNFLFSVKAVTFNFISGRSLAISSAKQGKSGSIYNLVRN